MNNIILLSLMACMCILSNGVYASDGSKIQSDNPWIVPRTLDISEKTSGTKENLEEIKNIETKIKKITELLIEIEGKLGKNFQDIGSPKTLMATGLRDLKSLYEKLIRNYTNIAQYHGVTDHYSMPLSAPEYRNLWNLLGVFAKKAGIEIKAEDILEYPIIKTEGDYLAQQRAGG